MSYKEENITLAIVTVLPEEHVAVKTILQNAEFFSPQGDPFSYYIGTIPVLDAFGGGEHKVVLNLLADMGNNYAAAFSNNIIRSFPNVKYIFMTGIAGGVPNPNNTSKHVRLGDIVVSRTILQYDYIKKKANGEIIFRDNSSLPSLVITQAIKFLESQSYEGVYTWHAHIDDIIASLDNKQFTRPKKDRLYDKNGNKIKHPKDPARIKGYPKIFHGVIGSANILLKDPEYRDLLSDVHKILAMEMEGAGIADATFMNERNYFIVRGISDYCDKYKNDDWHGYASVVAAACTRSLIEILPVQHEINLKNQQSISSANQNYEFNLFHGKQKITINDLVQSFIQNTWKKVLLIGDAGIGKTTLLESVWCFIKELRRDFVLQPFQLFLAPYPQFDSLDAFLFNSASSLPTNKESVLFLFDSLESIYSRNKVDNEQQVTKFILECTKSQYLTCLVTVRKDFFEATLHSELFYDFDILILEKWEDYQLSNFLQHFNIPLPTDARLKEILYTPFYANLYSKIFADLENLMIIRKFDIVSAFLKFEEKRSSMWYEVPKKQFQDFLEEAVWLMRLKGGSYLSEDDLIHIFYKVTHKVIPTTGFLSLFRYSDIGYSFSHELIAEYLTARRIINFLRYEEDDTLLSKIQTSYQEDMFIAEVIFSEQIILSEFHKKYQQTSSEILAVNIVGILAKIKPYKNIPQLLDFLLESEKVFDLYKGAVISRVIYQKSRIDHSDYENITSRKVQLLEKEIREGVDPIASLICLYLLSQLDDKKATSFQEFFLKKYGFNPSNHLRRLLKWD